MGRTKKIARVNCPFRIRPDVLAMADELAEILSRETGIPTSTGQAVEKSIKDLHTKTMKHEMRENRQENI